MAVDIAKEKKEKLLKEINDSGFTVKRLRFEYNLPVELPTIPYSSDYMVRIAQRLEDYFEEVNLLFSHILFTKKPEYISPYCPYDIIVYNLHVKNQWTEASTFILINRDDGILEFHINYTKLLALKELPSLHTVWLLFHEFRHKIQLSDERIQSVINYPNWENFKKYMMEITGKDEDLINHIFHEINPAEVDANIFACEMTGGKFNGNPFDINDQSLGLLGDKEQIVEAIKDAKFKEEIFGNPEKDDAEIEEFREKHVDELKKFAQTYTGDYIRIINPPKGNKEFYDKQTGGGIIDPQNTESYDKR